MVAYRNIFTKCVLFLRNFILQTNKKTIIMHTTIMHNNCIIAMKRDPCLSIDSEKYHGLSNYR